MFLLSAQFNALLILLPTAQSFQLCVNKVPLHPPHSAFTSLQNKPETVNTSQLWVCIYGLGEGCFCAGVQDIYFFANQEVSFWALFSLIQTWPYVSYSNWHHQYCKYRCSRSKEEFLEVKCNYNKSFIIIIDYYYYWMHDDLPLDLNSRITSGCLSASWRSEQFKVPPGCCAGLTRLRLLLPVSLPFFTVTL